MNDECNVRKGMADSPHPVCPSGTMQWKAMIPRTAAKPPLHEYLTRFLSPVTPRFPSASHALPACFPLAAQHFLVCSG